MQSVVKFVEETGRVTTDCTDDTDKKGLIRHQILILIALVRVICVIRG